MTITFIIRASIVCLAAVAGRAWIMIELTREAPWRSAALAVAPIAGHEALSIQYQA